MTKKILLIDDSKTQLYSLKIILTRAGYEVITEDNGISAIESACQNLPDIIVSDIMMPNINGYHLCRLLKNDPRTKSIPIILLTILSGKIDKFWGLKAGADKYINKDSEPQELIETIETLLKNAPEKPQAQTGIKDIHMDKDTYQAKINQILDQSLIESTIMNEFRNLTEFINYETKLTKELFTLLNSIIDFDIAGVFFNSCDEKKSKVLNIDFSTASLSEDLTEKLTADFFHTIFDEIDEDAYSNNLHTQTPSSINVIENEQDFKTKLIVPIKAENKITGAIALYSKKAIDYHSNATFAIILEELKLLLQVKSLHSQTKLMTIVDPLTNLYNRRYFKEILEREYSRAKRYENDFFSIAMFDIDKFKTINDTYGHQFGDEVLKEVSSIIISSLRNTDFAFRYGGEEIVAILTNSCGDSTFVPVERIRKKIEAKVFKFKDIDVKVTISAGISSTKQETKDSEHLVKLADKALYKAKETGRNKVLIHEKE